MPLHSLLDLQLTVPDPDGLVDFWGDLGLVVADGTTLGTADRPSQLRLAEGTYRHVSEMRLGCSDESDLVAIRASLEALGVASTLSDGVLRCADPLGDHDVVVEVAELPPLTTPPPRVFNRPGTQDRVNRRSTAAEQYRDDWDPFTIASWEPGGSKADFFLPADIEQLAAARQAAGR